MNPKPYVRQAFRKYLECGIFAHGFARAWCDDCGHDYFVAYSCKGRGVCPSCNTRRMVETAAQVNKAALHIGAIGLAKPQVHIHRFGSSLNGHVHLHVCAVDGVFEEVAGGADAQSSPPGIAFHPASGIDATAVAQVQTDLRRRIRRAFVGRGLLQSCDAKEMLAYPHSGFSVDAGGAHRSRRPRSPAAAAALLRPPTLCPGSARHGLTADAARVSRWVEGSSKGRYLALCG